MTISDISTDTTEHLYRFDEWVKFPNVPYIKFKVIYKQQMIDFTSNFLQNIAIFYLL